MLRSLWLFVVVVAAAAVVGTVGCGRSAQPRVACPAPADNCDDLAAQQAELQQVFLANAESDAATAKEAGDCAALLADVAFDQRCVAPCAALCALHPCDIVGGGDCAAACAAVDLADDVVKAAAVRAAERPGVCSCDFCDGDAAALCTDTFATCN